MDWYELELPVSKKKVMIKDWSFREDVELSKKIANIDRKDVKYTTNINAAFLDFIKAHVKEPNEVDLLCNADIYHIVIALVAASKGHIIDYLFKCTHTKEDGKKCQAYDQPQTGQLNILDDITYPEVNKDTHQIVVNDKLSFVLKPMNVANEINLLSSYEKFDMIDYKIDMIATVIHEIIQDGSVKSFGSFQEKKDYLLDNIKEKDIKVAIANFDKIKADIKITKKNQCPVCGNEVDIPLMSLDFFF